MKKYSLPLIALFFVSIVFGQIDRSKQPVPGPAPEINLSEPIVFSLSNGLKVMIVENKKLPRASASLVIDNPPVFEGPKAGVSELLGSLLGEGTTTISKDDFNEEVDFLGASISYSSQGANASSLSRYFKRILTLLAEGVIHPKFTQEEFEKKRDLLIDGIKSGEKSTANIARRVEKALAYGLNHPYGEFVTEESVQRVSLSDVSLFYDTYYKPNNAYLVIVGDVDEKEMKKTVKKLFKNWKATNKISSSFPTPKNASAIEIDFVNMPNAVQSEITVQNIVNLTMKDEDYFPALIANKILGGGGEARLFLNLREDKGYTYGSYSRIGNDKNTVSRFRANASVRNAVTDSAVVEILREVEKIRINPVSDDELANAKAKYIGDFVLALEKPSTIARYALNIETEGLSKDYYKNYLTKINAVTKEDVRRVAQKYFKVDLAKIVVTGKASEVLENLEKMTFKGKPISVNYYDKFGKPSSRPEKSNIPDGVTAKTILNDYLDAIGGTKLVKSVRSLVITYEGSAMESSITSEEKKTADKNAQVFSINGNPMMTMVVTKKEAFSKQGGQKMSLPQPMAIDLKNSVGIFPEIDFIENPKTTLVGVEEVDGKEAYKIQISGDVVSFEFFYDVASGLKVKESSTTNMGGQSQKQDSMLSDYQAFEGILFPTKKSQLLGQQSIEMTLKSVVMNTELTAEDFN